jgi:hypothetical protein
MLWLIGRYRMWWGWCPSCNSDAPEIDVCPVCLGDRTGRTRGEWWWRFEELRLRKN